LLAGSKENLADLESYPKEKFGHMGQKRRLWPRKQATLVWWSGDISPFFVATFFWILAYCQLFTLRVPTPSWLNLGVQNVARIEARSTPPRVDAQKFGRNFGRFWAFWVVCLARPGKFYKIFCMYNGIL
jgi:hypothetical protein